MINFSTDDYYGVTAGGPWSPLRRGNGSRYPGNYELLPEMSRLQLSDRSFVYGPGRMKRGGGSEMEGDYIEDCRTNRSKTLMGASSPMTNASRSVGERSKAVYKLKAMMKY